MPKFETDLQNSKGIVVAALERLRQDFDDMILKTATPQQLGKLWVRVWTTPSDFKEVFLDTLVSISAISTTRLRLTPIAPGWLSSEIVEMVEDAMISAKATVDEDNGTIVVEIVPPDRVWVKVLQDSAVTKANKTKELVTSQCKSMRHYLLENDRYINPNIRAAPNELYDDCQTSEAVEAWAEAIDKMDSTYTDKTDDMLDEKIKEIRATNPR